MYRLIAPLALSFGLTISAQAQSQLRIYRLGNSLTFQSQSPGIASMLQTRGFASPVVGYHVNCGSSLINTWNNPSSTCAGIPSIPSIFTTALPNNDWTAMSAQPFPGTGSTLGTDADVIEDLLLLMRQRPANSNSPLFIFATHPYTTTGPSYEAQWTATTPDTGDAQLTAASREYYDRLYSKVATSLGAANFSMIPSGEVLYQLDQRMKRGEFPGYTDVYKMYDDDIHTNNAGDYALGVTTFAAYTGQDPWGLTAPANYGTTGLSSTQYNILHDTVWKSICKDTRVRPIWYSDVWPYKVHRVGHLSDAVVRTNGTLVEAVNLGSTTSVTVNGVLFQGSLTRNGLTNSYSDSALYANGGISPGFETLMDSFSYANGAANPSTANVVFNNLVAGKRYEVQLFAADQRTTSTSTRRIQFELQGKTPFYVQQGMGCTITGAFVATDTSETLTIRALAGNGDPVNGSPILNAFQVRQVDALSDEFAAVERSWTGAGSDNKWSTAANWTGNVVPGTGQIVTFDNTSTAQLTNAADTARQMAGIRVTNPLSPVTVSGSALTVGSFGIDLSSAEQNTTLTTPVTMGTSHTWETAAGRVFTIGSAPGVGTFTPSANNLLSITGAGDVVLNETAAQQSWLLTKAGSGKLTLNSALNILNAAVTVQDGTLDSRNGRLFTNTTHVSSGGLRILGGTLELSDWTYGGPGLGWLRSNTDGVYFDGGTVRMASTSSYIRGFTMGAAGGTLNVGTSATWTLGFDTNTPIDNAANGPLTLSGEGTGIFDKVFPGTGANAKLTKSGTGTWTLTRTNTSIGTTAINQGTLLVTGSLGSGSVTVAADGTLSGTGTLNGATSVSGSIAPGTATPGTLSIKNAVVLGSGSHLKVRLGPTDDKLSITGNLTLDGTLDVTDAGGLTTGIRDVIQYSGTLVNNTLEIGSLPPAFAFSKIDTSIAGKVRLFVAATPYEAWQLENFGCSSCPLSATTTDADGDGVTNESEFLAGTNPLSNQSVMRITTASAANGVMTITWTSVPGKTYRVYYNDSLSGPWADTLPNSLITASTGQTSLSYQDTTASGPRRFYRVQVVP